MGKISQYTRALKAKLSDLFVVASSDNGSLSTKAVTTEQIGDAVITEQTFSGLDGKTPASAISDNATAIGDLSTLTTSDKSSLVGAVNEVNAKTTSTNTTVDIGTYGDDIQLCKSGKVVLMIINPFSSLPAGGWTQIGTLPSGYEPIIQTLSDMYSRDDRHLRIRLDTDRKIYVYNYSSAISSTNNAYWNITYITA